MPRRSFAAYPASVPAARGFVADVLATAPPELCRTAALLVSELATNAVRHSGTPSFVVDVDYTEGRPSVRLATAEDLVRTARRG